MSLEEGTLQYLVGYFDGEGCITVSIQRKRQHTLMCIVETGDKSVVELYHLHFGGSFTERDKVGCTGKFFHSYRWTVASKIAYRFLVIIKPFLKAKQSQAIVGIMLQDRMKGKGGTGHSLSEEEFNRREQLRLLLKSLKRKD